MLKEYLSIKREILFHLGFWVLWISLKIIFINDEGELTFKTGLFIWTSLLINASTFYLNYLIIMPKAFNPFNWKKAVIGLISIYAFFIGFRFLIEQYLTLHLFNRINYFSGFELKYYLFDNFFFGTKPVLTSSVFWLIIYSIRLNHYNHYIIEENKNSEIKFLKAQINPHFVFNTLNNIYSLIHLKSNKSLIAVEKLSEILRFTTYESQKDKIRLSTEINYINAFIELEKLRHEADTFVDFMESIENYNIYIPPYLLSPLVENALKHGKSTQKQPIIVKLESSSKKLTFSIENQIGIKRKDQIGGIGIDNLKSRLEIYFPDRHFLKITNSNELFICNLEINLI